MSRGGMLDGCTVLDMSTLFAAPLAATLLADHGADVIKIEHPRGDDLRHWGPRKDGHALWWKVVNRNKRNLAIDLHHPAGQEVVRRLAGTADVLISNFRPGRLDAWGLGWSVLHELNPRLILAEVTGFGQRGPYSGLPGFGTLAESMSGFAAVSGEQDGPPLLPPFGLADGIAGVTTAFAVAGALWARERSGVGVRIDTALYEPLMWIVGSHLVEYDQLGIVQERMGNKVPQIVPRNAYRTSDNQWVALSGAAQAVTARLFAIVGRPDMVEDSRFATNAARLRHRDEIDSILGKWIGERTQQEVVTALRQGDVAIAPIYDATHILADSHFRDRGSIVQVADDDLGMLQMQGVFPVVDGRPGSVRWSGNSHIGADTTSILSGLGYSDAEIQAMHGQGAVAGSRPPASQEGEGRDDADR
ncbi:CaiB/BaiF CoA transferase family protein [Phytohabitans kaempferiae]|uniref:CaiB/BaiF CoA transferase family protein n=1 Tax=Phytohabitans kaempferiae TaxID=1620943 RepID=A0ABV6MHW6_9ACTN